MLLVVQTALELGFLYAPVALALFLSFRAYYPTTAIYPPAADNC